MKNYQMIGKNYFKEFHSKEYMADGGMIDNNGQPFILINTAIKIL